nr:S-layer homology domain-containing protein [Alkalihalobacillus sp. TS-13]
MFAFNGDAWAADDIALKCDYVQEDGVNPDLSTANCLLTEAALEFDIPPEIVKAVAEGESGNWRHYDEIGEVIITDDNGIGMMQITNQSGYDEDLLKDDIVYNIRAGVETLDYMFDRNDLPTIGTGDRDVLEHWYFALMAYNGTKPVNSPIVQATGERNTEAYQEKIIKIVEDYGLVSFAELPFTRDDFDYDPSSDDNIEFVTMEYSFGEPFTKTKHALEAGQQVKVTSNNLKLRERPTTDSDILNYLAKDEVVTILGPFMYEETVDNKNHFVWYPVKTSNGIVGYVASSYLSYKFKDIDVGLYAEDEIYYLYEKSLLFGVGYERFGFKENLTRWQAVLLLNRANNVEVGNSPDPGFTDVPEDHKYYEAIAAAVEAGLFNGVTETTFEPDATLTRSQMAAVLQRIYQFPVETSHPFTDVKSGAWYEESIASLYNAGVAAGVSETKFGPNEDITREQFAVFMARSMNEDFRVR